MKPFECLPAEKKKRGKQEQQKRNAALLSETEQLKKELETVRAGAPGQNGGGGGDLERRGQTAFQRTEENRRFLATLRKRLAAEPLFVEFRHDSWLVPELQRSLRDMLRE